ncbi:DUF2946 domain-containing protein [Hydrogenophaga sp. PBL-H3]|uniref:DUF2946 domain-containing protein n=1 Tax=Hydrogenophaga sp. PBL-H3 TaxID=434010 RepID=UPI001357F48A|nr:DUF2946 domain-containing protein [Hydrogenophaga sp. PBL-H3]
MLARPFHRRFAAWLAMFAMVCSALAPTVAQAVVASQGGAGWVQVCSASGMVWVQADTAQAADGETLVNASESMADASRHCPWCNLHGAAGLPPASSPQPALALPAQPPRAQAPGAKPATFWPAAPSRAPPLA